MVSSRGQRKLPRCFEGRHHHSNFPLSLLSSSTTPLHYTVLPISHSRCSNARHLSQTISLQRHSNTPFNTVVKTYHSHFSSARHPSQTISLQRHSNTPFNTVVTISFSTYSNTPTQRPLYYSITPPLQFSTLTSQLLETPLEPFQYKFLCFTLSVTQTSITTHEKFTSVGHFKVFFFTRNQFKTTF